jgi:tetratricopeptide (TPR) repeat protein
MKNAFLTIILLTACSAPKLKKETPIKAEVSLIRPSKSYEISTINHLTKKIQLINSLVAMKKYQDALEEINFLIKKYPKNYVFYDMEGSVYYLQGNQNLALDSFEKSLRLNPKNKEAQSMVDKTKKQL